MVVGGIGGASRCSGLDVLVSCQLGFSRHSVRQHTIRSLSVLSPLRRRSSLQDDTTLSDHTSNPGKPGILSSTFPGLEKAWNMLKKWGKSGILIQNLKQIQKFVNSMFQDLLLKMSCTKKIHLDLCHVYIIKTNTVIQNQINLGFLSFYMEIMKIHGISCHHRSGSPATPTLLQNKCLVIKPMNTFSVNNVFCSNNLMPHVEN